MKESIDKAATQLAVNTNENKPVVEHQSAAASPAHSVAAMQRQPKNNTGLPDHLKSGMENLSGMSLDHVKVHYNSSKPATVQAHAYAQGSHIHLASGQEKHLPHELGHVVQQMQGRVKPTTSVGGMAVNDHAGLESEATIMGEQALVVRQLTKKEGKKPENNAKKKGKDPGGYNKNIRMGKRGREKHEKTTKGEATQQDGVTKRSSETMNKHIERLKKGEGEVLRTEKDKAGDITVVALSSKSGKKNIYGIKKADGKTKESGVHPRKPDQGEDYSSSDNDA